MKDQPDPERIEIELTSNVDPEIGGVGRDGSGNASEELIATGSTDDTGRPLAPDSRRLFAVAAVVGVVALLLGWLIGRSSGSDEVATTSVTTPETTEPVTETLMPGEALPSVSTTRPRRTTTSTTMALPTTATIVIDQRLEGVDLLLVGSERSRDLVVLDLAEQTLTRQIMSMTFEPEALLVGEDWVVLQSFGGGTTTLLRDGEAPQRMNGWPWQLLWQEGTDRFWRPGIETETFNGPSLYEEIDVTGELTGVALELPVGAWVDRADPRGGLVTEVTGKNYSIGEAGVVLIGAGQMIGLSEDIAVLKDCDERLRCGLFVTDRQTGVVHEVALDTDLIALEPLYGWGPPDRGQAISPDGTMVAVMLPSSTSPVLGLIDLSSGVVVELGQAAWAPRVVWSPDGRFAFFLEGEPDFGGSGERTLSAYDRESGEVFAVSSEPLAWQSLAARSTGS